MIPIATEAVVKKSILKSLPDEMMAKDLFFLPIPFKTSAVAKLMTAMMTSNQIPLLRLCKLTG